MTRTLQEALVDAAARPDAWIQVLDRRGQAERRGCHVILEAAARIAAGLARLGVGAGDRVALVLPTGFDFVEAFFGIIALRAVPVPLYPPVRLGRLEDYHETTARLLTSAGVKAVLTDRLTYGLLGRSVEGARPELGCHLVSGLRGARGEMLRLGTPEELALVQFSSGTTVDPKPVALSHANLIANIASITAALPGSPREHSGVCWLPLYHDMGLIGCLLTAVVLGRPMTLLRPQDFAARPALWLRAISSTRATVSAAPNFAYALCAERVREDDLAGLDLSSWKVALVGAEPVQASTLEKFARRFAPCGFRPEALTPVYGLSEATLGVTFSDPLRRPRALDIDPAALAATGVVKPAAGGRRIVSVGRPLAGVQVEVRNGFGRAMGEDRVGDIHVRGGAVMGGYLDRPDQTRATLADGWLCTGDTGFWHEGELYVCGRKKDVIVLRGRKYDPQTVETAVHEVAQVREGCVAAFSFAEDDRATEALCVLIERRAGASMPDETLADRAREAIARRTGLIADRIEVLAPGTLPRTTSGKIRRGAAREMLRAGALRAPGRGGVMAILRGMVDGYRAHRRAGA